MDDFEYNGDMITDELAFLKDVGDKKGSKLEEPSFGDNWEISDNRKHSELDDFENTDEIGLNESFVKPSTLNILPGINEEDKEHDEDELGLNESGVSEANDVFLSIDEEDKNK